MIAGTEVDPENREWVEDHRQPRGEHPLHGQSGAVSLEPALLHPAVRAELDPRRRGHGPASVSAQGMALALRLRSRRRAGIAVAPRLDVVRGLGAIRLEPGSRSGGRARVLDRAACRDSTAPHGRAACAGGLRGRGRTCCRASSGSSGSATTTTRWSSAGARLEQLQKAAGHSVLQDAGGNAHSCLSRRARLPRSEQRR